jgi:ATP-binding cassette subfamily B (MDR/TAP) protein 1
MNLKAAGLQAEVIASVSNESMVVQDVLSEKIPTWRGALPRFWEAMLIGRLAPDQGAVHLPRCNRRAGRVSSARTMYSFAMERNTMARFSATLEESARLGIKHGLHSVN